MSAPPTAPAPVAPAPVAPGGGATGAVSTPPTTPESTGSSIIAGFEGLLWVFFFLLLLLGPAVSAAKLSYDKYGSFLWAILDFFFPVFYIPYYAFFLNTPTSSTFGGRGRRR